MKKILIKLIILFIIIISFFKIVVYARYYEKIENIKIVANIAEIVCLVEKDETKTIKMNNQSNNKEYYFTIKNYYIDERNNKRINEIDFDFNIEILISDKNFPIGYKLYDCSTEKEIQNYSGKIPKDIEFENRYKLVVFWKEKSIMAKNADIEIEITGKYAKNSIKAFSLTRDNIPITYSINKSNNEKYTNQNILLTIELNKPIKPVDGFNLSQDGKKLTRLVENNEKVTIIVEDNSGNKTPITYEITNIDKSPPEIIGVEDGKVYSGEINLNYKDNSGIKDIIVLNKYTKTNSTNPYKLTENGAYEIIVTDLAGNKTRKRISIT